jgi:predicted transcriptional regulator
MIATKQNTEQNFDNFSQVLDRLDEFGLTPIQFRIYCHLFKNAVDGVVSESSESIASICKLTRITVLRVLSQLVQMNLIKCEVTPGKKSVFHLMPFSDWQQPVSEQKQSIARVQSKVVPLRVSEGRQAFRQGHRNQSNSDTCKPTLQVNQINTQEQGRQDNPVGLSCLPPAEKPVNEIDVSTADTGSLDGKLAAARARGWQDSGTWWMTSGQQVVTVNRFVVTVGEFMGRSLDSFDVGRQVCAEGLRMCQEQIERIKQRKHQQQCDRYYPIARVGNSLEQEFCYG